jgi:Zn-dependent M28 family amino/carboxypeptidase
MPFRRILALSLIPAAALSAQTPQIPEYRDDPIASIESEIDVAGLRSTIRFVAHDLLEGRGVGSRGDALARAYIRSRFEHAGLEPGGPDGAWEQPVPIVGIRSRIEQPLRVTGPGGGVDFEAPTDFVVFAGQPDETSRIEDAELVFVGYGIDAPEQNWDDYGDFDCKGKVLLFMNNDPASSPDLFEGERRLYYGRWSYKYEEAARRGAVGAIVIHTTPSAGYPFQVIQSGHEREQFWLPFEEGAPGLVARMWCSEDAARQMAALGGLDLDALRRSAEARDFQPVPLGVRVEVGTKNEVRELESANVLAVLPGSDPELKDEYVVVSAHFDHLGIGPEKNGDDIYNGASDNATGTAGLLEMATAVARLEPRPRRSILFATVTAEESGLLGAKYFARHPTVGRRQLVANVNLDGLNHWGPTEDIEMIGYGKNSLTWVVAGVAERRGRVLKPNAEVDKGLFYRSDHFAFAQIGVPAVFLKPGSDFLENADGRRRLQNRYTLLDYHQPSDEYDDRWILEGMVEDARLILETLVRVANAPEAPTWTPGDEFERLR